MVNSRLFLRQYVCEKAEAASGSTAATTTASTANPACSCDTGNSWFGLLATSKCYKVNTPSQTQTWAQAKAACEATSGATLASIPSKTAQLFLQERLTIDLSNADYIAAGGPAILPNNAYIGGSDSAQDGTWKWTDDTVFWTGASQGSTSTYANWWTGASGQPAGGTDQNCAHFRKKDGMWDDTGCDPTSVKSSICMK